MPPDVGHAANGRRPAEPLAARLKDAATGEMPLRYRVIAPVPRAAFEVRRHGCRHADRPVIRPSPGLDEQHPGIGSLAQTRREDATGGSGAHDDVVEHGHGRMRWPAVVGILRATTAARDPASCRASNRPTHSAAHLERSSYRPNAPRILWNTRDIARGRLRFADGRFDRSLLTADGNFCPRGASAGTSDHFATFEAGTIIGGWNASTSPFRAPPMNAYLYPKPDGVGAVQNTEHLAELPHTPTRGILRRRSPGEIIPPDTPESALAQIRALSVCLRGN